MNTIYSSPQSRRPVAAICALVCGLAVALTAAEKKEPLPENYIDVSFTHIDMDGDNASFRRLQQLNEDGVGGVEALHYTGSLSDTTSYLLEGRALAGTHDYLFDLTFTNDDVGHIKLGYKRYRVFYDGSGGYLPVANYSQKLYNEELGIDRGNLWFEAAYLAEDKPQFILRYDLFTRKGTKDSTSWGDTGLAINAANLRAVLPSFWEIDEKRHQLTADLSQTRDNATWALGVRADKGEYTNARKESRRIGEPTAQRRLTHKEGQDYDLFQMRGSYENRINDKLMVTTAVARTTIDTTLSGSRIYGQDFDPVFDPVAKNRQYHDEGFFDLHGEAEMKQTIGTLNARYQATNHLVIVPAFRFEKIDWSNFAEFEESNVGAPPSLVTAVEAIENDSDKDWKVLAESLEARYTGIKNVSLNLKGEWTKSDGTLTEESIIEPGTSHEEIGIDRESDFERNTQKYAATANWYVRPGTTLAVQYYYKLRTNDFRAVRDSAASASNRYPAYIANQDFETNDFNVRLSTKLGARLRSVTRYDYQESTIRTQDIGLAFAESADMTTHVIAETVTWNPQDRWYVQGSANLVWDTLRTPAAAVTGNAADRVMNSDANYTYFSLGSGYALDDDSDLYFNYTVSKSHDSFVDNSARTVAYGSEYESQLASVTWTRRLDRNIWVTFKYAYANYDDVVSGGQADYEAHLFYGKMQYRF